MSERAVEFVEMWVGRHVNAGTDPAQAKALAHQCMEEAGKEGITLSEIDDVFDDLSMFIAGEIEEAKQR
jgi:hypothetical protein